MGRNKQNEKAKKDGKHRKETKEEKKERLENVRQAREAFLKTVPYGLGVLVLFLILFGFYVHSIPPREAVKKAATDDAFKVGADGVPKFMTTEGVGQKVQITAENPNVIVPPITRESLESENAEETLEL